MRRSRMNASECGSDPYCAVVDLTMPSLFHHAMPCRAKFRKDWRRRSTPELHGAHSVPFLPGSHYDMHSVGQRMAGDGLPGMILFGIGSFILAGRPTVAVGIEQQLGPHQGSDPGARDTIDQQIRSRS